MNRRHFVGMLAAGAALVPRRAAAQAEIPVTGRARPLLARFDRIMRDLMRTHEIPGGSLAMARDGRLVYARGFGWASSEGRTPARPETAFGLASVSKAITAAAILKLVDGRRLALDDRAFALLRDVVPEDEVAPRARATTVRQLLIHSGGYEQNPDGRQIARRLGVAPATLREVDLVRAFASHPLDYEPGTQQHYSNFGFVVLGAIVAHLAGKPYQEAIHALVFGPIGVRRARVGHGEPYGPNEAHRHDKGGRELPPIDLAGGSSGGWIVPTVEMVRFLAVLHGPPGHAFLSPAARRTMLAPPPAPLAPRANGAWFGLGWDVVRETPRGPSYTKNGGIEGVRAAVGHAPGAIDWAVAFNGGREPEGIDGEAIRAVEAGIEATREWPEGEPFLQSRG